MAGVTAAGFVLKTLAEILANIETAETSLIDPEFDTSPEEPIGQVNGIMANQAAQLWEIAAICYNAMNRDAGEGVMLDNINGMTGTVRKGPKPSYTSQTCVFSQTGTYLHGALVANVSGQPSVQFANGFDVVVTLESGTYYARQNNLVLASGVSLPLTVAGVKFLALVDGPVVANAATLTVITTPVTGWASTTNPLDAVLGNLIEGDTDYRLRGDAELAAAGSGNPDALRADVLNVPGVIQAFVIENTTDILDSYSNPPHSATVVIWDGSSPAADNNAVAQVLWDDKPTGMGYNGPIVTGQATDSNGGLHIMRFARAANQSLYIDITGLTMLPGRSLDATTRAAIKQAIVTATQMIDLPDNAPNPAYLNLGADVVAEALKSAVLSAGLGVKDVPTLKLGFAPSPSGTTNLALNLMQIAIADTSRITVNGS